MNAVAILKIHHAAGRPDAAAAVSVGLWLFMGVATALFSLFTAAYVMRMDASDWSAIAMPWQLWLSTALLGIGSVCLQRACRTTPAGARALLLAGGTCALAFLGVQLWAWQALLAIHVGPAGNPAASFFYTLTALHGLHVAGGLIAWAVTARGHWRAADTAQSSWRITLCARYWHFLLAVWLLLFATLAGLTPEVVRFICGTN